LESKFPPGRVTPLGEGMEYGEETPLIDSTIDLGQID
jgi:hypothetical protein